MTLPGEGRRAVVSEDLAREALVDRLCEVGSLLHVWRRGLEPDQIRVRRVRKPARDRRFKARLDEEVPLGRALAGEELVVALVDVARDQRSAEGVGTRDYEGRHVADVGRETGGGQRADETAPRGEHLAAEMAAF